jgi:hypothetical protein
LAQLAQDWLNHQQQSEQCIMRHPSQGNRDEFNRYMMLNGQQVGQNLAANGGSNLGSPQQSVQSWFDEYSCYNWNSPGYQPCAGHFTQVVWKGTTDVGCASITCPRGANFGGGAQPQRIYACNYLPAGNVSNPGQFQANVARPDMC